MQKKRRKVPSIDFSRNLEKKLILVQFWVPFGPKTSQQSFSRQIIFLNFKSLYAVVALSKKIRNVPCTDF